MYFGKVRGSLLFAKDVKAKWLATQVRPDEYDTPPVALLREPSGTASVAEFLQRVGLPAPDSVAGRLVFCVECCDDTAARDLGAVLAAAAELGATGRIHFSGGQDNSEGPFDFAMELDDGRATFSSLSPRASMQMEEADEEALARVPRRRSRGRKAPKSGLSMRKLKSKDSDRLPWAEHDPTRQEEAALGGPCAASLRTAKGNLIAVTWVDGEQHVVQTGMDVDATCTRVAKLHPSERKSVDAGRVAFQDNGSALAFLTDETCVQLMALPAGERSVAYDGPPGIRAIAFAGDKLLVLYWERLIALAPTDEGYREVASLPAGGDAVEVTRDSRKIGIKAGDWIRVAGICGERLRWLKEGPVAKGMGALFARGDHLLATGDDDDDVREVRGLEEAWQQAFSTEAS